MSTIATYSNILTFSSTSKKDIYLDEYALSTSYVVEITEVSRELDSSRQFIQIQDEAALKKAVQTLDEQSIERVILENYEIPLETAKYILTPYMCNLTPKEMKHINPIRERFFGNPKFFKVQQN